MSYQAFALNFFIPLNDIPEIKNEIDLTNNIWLENHSTNDELILFHYTNLEGLKGIITNRSIWCTQINALNDPFEFKYGKELIIKELNDFIERENDIKIKTFLSDLKDFVNISDKLTTHYIFLASFCKSDNLLSQWRGYSARGGGYNLGISFNDETKICYDIENLDKNDQIILRKIIYNTDAQKRIINLYITNLIRGMRGTVNNWQHYENHVGPSLGSQIELAAQNLLMDMMLSMKNPAFEEENEWRLIRRIGFNQIPEFYKFRENNNILIPYLNTYLYNNVNDRYEFPLKNIRFGPMLDDSSTKIAVNLFVKNSATALHKINLKNDIPVIGAGYILRE